MYALPIRRPWVLGMGLAVMLGLTTAWGAQQKAPPDEHSAAWHKTTKALGKHMPRVEFHDIELKDVVEFFQEVTEAKMRPDWAAMKKIGVTRTSQANLVVLNLSLRRALELTLASTVGLGRIECVVGEDGTVQIRPAKPKPPAQPAKPTEKQLATRKKLATRIARVEFEDAELANVIAFLCDVSDANIFVDWPSLRRIKLAPDTKVALELRNAPVAKALTAILKATSADKALRWEVDATGVVLIHALPPRPTTRPASRKKGKAPLP